ncbi:hypothetical protein [Jannaschia seohaensis]|uniref:Uncharacterized protein n=1 Tax=Jannaschia seohaensis TaxID=475081 RepID=A0A2Y9AYP5_9RHOB|nr:hypothetical protein [Jannaschia seohaensis]PWJ16122.1 hypothetical protein BCF38_1095 [Jannaschia seohaensis]SSA48985.1 hypothetical protein SAMN05421539_1095 [Jannaschia seohaensis]
MQDDMIHEGEPGFEDFIEEEMAALGNRAQQRGICLDCLTDRFIVEMVANLARSGLSSSDILSMVVDGLALAEEEEPTERVGRMHRMH